MILLYLDWVFWKNFKLMKSHPQLVLVIKKDWDINLDDNLSLEELHHRLADYINQLMVNDFNRLLNLLYRIDVNEEKLKTSLKEFYDKDLLHN